MSRGRTQRRQRASAPLHLMVHAAFLSALLGGEARAEELRLSWDAPASCPPRAAVLTRVELLLLRALSPRGLPLIFEARVGQTVDARWSLRLEQVGVAPPRRLEGATCEGVADAAALALSLALSDRQVREPAAQVSQPAVVAVPSGDPQAWWVGFDGRVGLGVLAKAAMGGRVVGAWAGRFLRLEAELGSGLRQTLALRDQTVHIALQMVVSGGLRACGELHADRWTLVLCADVDLGVLEGSSTGVAQPARGAAPWWGIGLTTGVAIPLGSDLAVRVRAGGGVVLSRPTFVLEGTGVVFAAPAAYLTLSFGLEYRFWQQNGRRPDMVQRETRPDGLRARADRW